ncbi:MAG TPA: hotdog fold thioesterase [Streptosporangiaceae bacterium]|nr:hotdog fold thioesterase [Streptosporangiaceae bacterium]
MAGSQARPAAVTGVTVDVGEHLYNPIGSVHGGIFCTLLDSAMGCAVHTTLPLGHAYTTLELNVSMVKPLEDSNDVQDVYANYSVSGDVMEKLG